MQISRRSQEETLATIPVDLTQAQRRHRHPCSCTATFPSRSLRSRHFSQPVPAHLCLSQAIPDAEMPSLLSKQFHSAAVALIRSHSIATPKPPPFNWRRSTAGGHAQEEGKFYVQSQAQLQWSQSIRVLFFDLGNKFFSLLSRM
ncbi:hypothetical protein Drorol1_Dr00013154 [Drosera rotundifolia]